MAGHLWTCLAIGGCRRAQVWFGSYTGAQSTGARRVLCPEAISESMGTEFKSSCGPSCKLAIAEQCRKTKKRMLVFRAPSSTGLALVEYRSSPTMAGHGWPWTGRPTFSGRIFRPNFPIKFSSRNFLSRLPASSQIFLPIFSAEFCGRIFWLVKLNHGILKTKMRSDSGLNLTLNRFILFTVLSIY